MRNTFNCWLAMLTLFSATLGASIARIELGVVDVITIVGSFVLVVWSAYALWQSQRISQAPPR